VADVVYVALGSNLGDRHAALAAARDAIAATPGCELLAVTAVEETAPLGPADQPPYLNQMARVRTTLSPTALLDRLQEIERAAGRVRAERWGPRTLDLDVVLIEGRSVRTGRLTVPHPELARRDFWQRELAELGGSP
jgi:2-amino-4-hydroxy-6-hydroxymethyldihydropteridine diphosphokinase